MLTDKEIEVIDNIQAKAKEIFEYMETALFEREELVRILVLAVFAKENLFMYGPPGTAKTNIADTLELMTEGSFFTMLMTDFTHYDDIFGKELKRENGLSERILEGKLPTADYAFLDEIFKANSKILNSLLTVLNERKFDDDYNGRIDVNLEIALAASNEFPRESYLKALFERFVFRIPVPNIKDKDNRKKLFNGKVKKIENLPKFKKEEINFIRESFAKKEIIFKEEESLILSNLIDTLHQVLNPEKSSNKKDAIESLYEISGRTMFKMGSIMRISAYLNKRDYIDLSDLLLSRYILWNSIFERDIVLPKINSELFGGEMELHGDTSRILDGYGMLLLRYVRGIKIKFNGTEIIGRDSEFIEFKKDAEEFILELKESTKGLYKISEKLKECKEKEEIVKKNIFIYFEKILDWKVEESQIKVESQKFMELSREVNDFEEIERDDKFMFRKLIDKVFEIQNGVLETIENWLYENETFFDYKENIKNKK